MGLINDVAILLYKNLGTALRHPSHRGSESSLAVRNHGGIAGEFQTAELKAVKDVTRGRAVAHHQLVFAISKATFGIGIDAFPLGAALA